MKLDLGSGMFPKEGYVSVDRNPAVKPDILLDVDMAFSDWAKAIGSAVLPWERPSNLDKVTGVHTSHLVEHVNNLIAFMNKVYRLCEHNSLVIIRHPYQHSNRAWQDPTHKRALNEDTWRYFDANWRRDNLGDDHYADIQTHMTMVDLVYVWEGGVEMRHNAMTPVMRNAMRHSVNVIDDLIVTLQVLK